MAEVGGDARAGIGTRLRAAREKKGLTLLQTAERLHVDARIVEWLEAENFAALGAPVYARGHLRHYAELVDESPAQLQELYANATKAQPAQPDLTKIARGEPENDNGWLARPAMVGLVAIAAVGAVWWFIQTSERTQPAAPAQTQTQSQSGATPAAADEASSAAPAGDTASGAPVPPTVPKGTASPAVTNTKPTTPGARTSAANSLSTPAATSNTRTGAAPAHADAGAATATTSPGAATSGATAPLPAARGKDGELTLKFNSDSWAEVYDATGQRLFYDVGAASSTHVVRGPAPLRVVLGNASGVALQYNGHAASIPSAKRPDGSTQFMINAHGHTTAAARASNGD
jgi:cytoskeleton protein RodZ